MTKLSSKKQKTDNKQFQYPKIDELDVSFSQQQQQYETNPNRQSYISKQSSNKLSKSRLLSFVESTYIKNIMKYSKLIVLIGQTIFHYFDIVTDYLLIISAVEIWENTQIQKYKETWRNVIIILISVLVIERYKSYQYLSELKAKQNKEEENNGQAKNDDLIELEKSAQIKKGILEMYFENVVYQLVGLNVLTYQINIGQTVKTTVLLSVLSSMCSTSYVIYQTYVMRTRYSKVFEDKKNQPFDEFSIKTKLFISNPFTIQSLKPNTKVVQQYPELYKISYLQLQAKYKENFDFTKLYYSTKISIFQHIYLIIIMTCYVLGNGILLILQSNNKYGIFVLEECIIGFILYLPQVIVYVGLLIVSKDQLNAKERYWKIFITILLSPLLAVYGLLIFMAPIKSDRIPFTPQIQENWLYNFFSTGYTLLVRQALTTFWIWGCYKFIFLGIDYNENKYPDGQGIDNIVDPNSPIRIIFYIAFVAFIVNTIQTLMYMYENLVHKFLTKKDGSQLKEEQQQLIRRQNKIISKKINEQAKNDIEQPIKNQKFDQLRCIDCHKQFQFVVLAGQNESKSLNNQIQIQSDAQQLSNSQNLMALQKVQSIQQRYSKSGTQTPSQLQVTMEQASQSNVQFCNNNKIQKYQENVNEQEQEYQNKYQNNDSQICTDRKKSDQNNNSQLDDEQQENTDKLTNLNQLSQKEVSFDMENQISPKAYKKNGILSSAVEKFNNSFLSPTNEQGGNETDRYDITQRGQTDRPILKKQVIAFHNGDAYLQSPNGLGENMFISQNKQDQIKQNQ
ncbi:hypothetical protein PPERSA_04789 [Pseudocohnilembus persalinus]|uniref:Transmembrane protein n=1 Tax=Pseudocohnilembus persalinus TaxID=266149 RepID=A0A0V0Q9D0_PSEPJ|nr:hypothetical protein PPERSA_04789 [Pseudocohnilembus persalinus]|eukprot:KRW98856.1 hypothetical protein PPERSA_04789 [Pseudocohnilembus persalinus]